MIDNEFDKYLKTREKLDLDTDEVYKAFVHTLILILVLIVIPLLIFFHTNFNNTKELSYNILFDSYTTIDKIYNKCNYGSIRNV